MEKLRAISRNRFIIFLGFFAVVVLATKVATGNYLPTTTTKDLWFYSGIFMVLFSVLFIEPYYSSPKNVISNAVPLLLVFLAVEPDFTNKFQWWLLIGIIIFILAVSIASISIKDENKSPESKTNMLSERLKNIAVLLGRGKVLYSAVFLYFLFDYYVYDKAVSGYVFFLLILWAVILLINPKELTSTLFSKKRIINDSAIGDIFGVQSKRMFLVKLFEDRRNIRKFDLVKFQYSMQDDSGIVMAGIVFDYYLLNQEKWAKVLYLDNLPSNAKNRLLSNTVYKIEDEEETKLVNDNLSVDRFVGIVTDGSKISRIRFEYSKKDNNLQEGDLLELKVGKKRLFYQVVYGHTAKEKLEARNESGFVEGEAAQLGEWDNKTQCFEKFGWVPEINTPLFMADTSDIKTPKVLSPEYTLGYIPNTSLPSIINLNDAISHHMALLGVTGSGKSYLAREIIRELQHDTKVLIIDFTGEWSSELSDLSIDNMPIGGSNIDAFLESDENKIGVVGVPTMSNTAEVIVQVEKFFEKVFNHAKKKYDEGTPTKIALVLEEAHTITPETSFLGDLGDYGSSKAMVNKMGQVALQGRKYGVGLLVIAQRTANVSKTVLTQCNTVICFQAFDETSFNFLGNYVGKDMVQALPNLKQYHAIVAGKAIKSSVPMIVNLHRPDVAKKVKKTTTSGSSTSA